MFGAPAVKTLRISLQVSLTVRRFELILVTKPGVITMGGVFVVVVVRRARTVARAAVLLAVVQTILKAIPESRAAVVSIAAILPTRIAVGIAIAIIFILSAAMLGAFL